MSSDVSHQVVEVRRPAVEPQLAADHPAEVQEVVDQPGLQRDVAADHRQVFLHLRRQARGHLQQGDGRDHRRQRGAQLVAEHGEEPVLGQAGGLGGLLGLLQLRLGLLARRDVLHGADDPDGAPIAAASLEDDPALGVHPADVPSSQTQRYSTS